MKSSTFGLGVNLWLLPIYVRLDHFRLISWENAGSYSRLFFFFFFAAKFLDPESIYFSSFSNDPWRFFFEFFPPIIFIIIIIIIIIFYVMLFAKKANPLFDLLKFSNFSFFSDVRKCFQEF